MKTTKTKKAKTPMFGKKQDKVLVVKTHIRAGKLERYHKN